ncbi:carboxymuconolactone decarboxylase family protein [Hoeflea sp. BAL378]|uniref:carboxymuconolactone decarboxylase family protein n=1 Tax=Hoeflea sp. BAL378 TaxID=1547437 RepID=UPI0009DF9B0B|nr:carboxymuconolactone decarboxylase family protein [Hoeflea sp. BAL378]
MNTQTALSETAPGTALERGRAIVAQINPGLEQALAAKYDAQFPEFAETLVEFAYGRLYAREGLDLKTRQIATVAALTALGGQTGPQLRVNLEHALAAGASRRELLEVILQMSVYGGMPAAINGMNVAMQLFEEQDAASA